MTQNTFSSSRYAKYNQRAALVERIASAIRFSFSLLREISVANARGNTLNVHLIVSNYATINLRRSGRIRSRIISDNCPRYHCFLVCGLRNHPSEKRAFENCIVNHFSAVLRSINRLRYPGIVLLYPFPVVEQKTLGL